jgi:hypothetical protein
VCLVGGEGWAPRPLLTQTETDGYFTGDLDPRSAHLSLALSEVEVADALTRRRMK